MDAVQRRTLQMRLRVPVEAEHNSLHFATLQPSPARATVSISTEIRHMNR